MSDYHCDVMLIYIVASRWTPVGREYVVDDSQFEWSHTYDLSEAKRFTDTPDNRDEIRRRGYTIEGPLNGDNNHE